MRRLFTMMASQVQSTAELLRHWWSTLSPDPSTWVPFTWVLAALVLVMLLTWILRPRRSATARRPELLISHGELRVRGAAASVSSSLHAPDDVAFVLSMTVSNLSAVPVQLLELAVRTNGSSAPTTADVPAVLPPHGAVEVTAELREAGGDEGTLELFVYVPDMRPKTFRVRARLLWEPWNARFRVLPLDQKVEPARGLAERGLRRREVERRPQARGAASRRQVADGRGFGPRLRESGPESEVRFEPRPESARPRSLPIGSPSDTVRGTEPDDAVDLPRGPRSGGASGAAPPARPEAPPDADVAPYTPSYTPPNAAAIWPPRRPRAAEGRPDAARSDDVRPDAVRPDVPAGGSRPETWSDAWREVPSGAAEDDEEPRIGRRVQGDPGPG